MNAPDRMLHLVFSRIEISVNFFGLMVYVLHEPFLSRPFLSERPSEHSQV